MASIVSELLGGIDHFRTVVKTHDQHYCIDTCYIDYKGKYETIAVPCNATGDIIHWHDEPVARVLYEIDDKARDAQQYKLVEDGHYKVVNELEEHIKCFFYTQIEEKEREIEYLKDEIAQLTKQVELFTENKEA